jgi:hypothetical protein
METHHYLSSVRDQIESLLQKNRLVIGAEILAVALFPLFLVLVQLPQTIVPLLLLGWRLFGCAI